MVTLLVEYPVQSGYDVIQPVPREYKAQNGLRLPISPGLEIKHFKDNVVPKRSDSLE
jgi:hypothetical protein